MDPLATSFVSVTHFDPIQKIADTTSITPENGERVGHLTSPYDAWDRWHHGLDSLHLGETELVVRPTGRTPT